jgi:DNA-directed RNA polymerase subunit RPC12/RpoP
MANIIQCPQCKSRTFFVIEENLYKASSTTDGKEPILDCTSLKDTSITRVTCIDCGHELPESDWESIDFNF